ncbi:hypothetical protein RSUY_03550 [Ralstonia solanacearum]|nr:hypothetical protein RSUY_03550 [Ralstonia solanacearum]
MACATFRLSSRGGPRNRIWLSSPWRGAALVGGIGGHRVGFHHSAVFRGLADLENRASGASHGHARVHVRRTGCPLPARKRGYERAVVRHRSRETHRQDLFPLHVAKRDVVFSTPPSHVRSGFLPVCACPRRARKAGGGHSLTGCARSRVARATPSGMRGGMAQCEVPHCHIARTCRIPAPRRAVIALAEEAVPRWTGLIPGRFATAFDLNLNQISHSVWCRSYRAKNWG